MAKTILIGRRADLSVSAVIMAIIALLVLAGIILGPVQGVMKYWQKQKESIGPKNAELPEESAPPWKVGEVIAFKDSKSGQEVNGRIDRVEASKEVGWIFAGPVISISKDGSTLVESWWRFSESELSAAGVRVVPDVPDTAHGDPQTGSGYCGNGVIDSGEICDTAAADQLYGNRFSKEFFRGEHSLTIEGFAGDKDVPARRKELRKYSLEKICAKVAYGCNDKQAIKFDRDGCADDCKSFKPLITCTDTAVIGTDSSSSWRGPVLSKRYDSIVTDWKMAWQRSSSRGSCVDSAQPNVIVIKELEVVK